MASAQKYNILMFQSKTHERKSHFIFYQHRSGCLYLCPPPDLPVKNLLPLRSPGSSSWCYPSQPSHSGRCDSECDSCALRQDRQLVGQASISAAIIHLHSWELVTNYLVHMIGLSRVSVLARHTGEERSLCSAAKRQEELKHGVRVLSWLLIFGWLASFPPVKKCQK